MRTITMLSWTPLGLASPPFPITWRRLRVFRSNANTRARFAPEPSGTKGDPEAKRRVRGTGSMDGGVDAAGADVGLLRGRASPICSV